MGHATLILALTGFAVGTLFRFKTLLLVVLLTLLVSIVASVAQGLDFISTALELVVVQAVVQGSYFVGLLTRFFFAHNPRQVL
jgi:hypothetical protein